MLVFIKTISICHHSSLLGETRASVLAS